MATVVATNGRRQIPPGARALMAGAASAVVGAVLLQIFPWLRLDGFAAAAARFAAFLTGAGVERGDLGWILTLGGREVAVTAACSGTDFFLMVAALIAWRCGGAMSLPRAAVAGLLCALPVTVLVNALRVIAVAQAHRWVIPLLPERHAAFAHMLTGAAVFLPSLIVLNLALESYARRHRSAPV